MGNITSAEAAEKLKEATEANDQTSVQELVTKHKDCIDIPDQVSTVL